MSLNPKIPTEDLTDKVTIVEERNSKGEIIKKYSKGRFLGKGGFAKCYEMTSLDTKRIYAAKIITKASLTKSRAKQKLMSEIKIHRSLHHLHIVGFEHFFEDAENVYILLEMCTNQTMNELIRRRKRLTELEVQCYVNQMISALKNVHGHRVIHRDLKLGNLFLSEKMEIKVGDFGLATKLEYDGEKKRTICGTPNYIAPEILEGKTGHSYEVDVWSLGVIIYTLLIGKPPFETSDVKTTYRRIRMNAYSFPEHVAISSAARCLITKILNTDPSKRPTLDEILSHEFMTTGTSIPKVLPISTLACPPSASYIRQFLPSSRERDHSAGQGRTSPQKFDNTAPLNNRNSLKERKDFMNTDRMNTLENAKSNSNFNYSSNNPTGSTKIVDSKIPLNTESGSKPIQVNRLVMEGSTNSGALTTAAPLTAKISITSGHHRESTGGSNQPLSPFLGTQMTSGPQIDNLISSRNLFDKTEKNPFNTSGAKPKSASGTYTLSGGNLNLNNGTQTSSTLNGAEIWVKRWVDYSSKYGLGYLLSNGITGVFFNDSTKIILNSKGSNFLYIEKKGPEKQDSPTEYTLTDYPKDLQKKVTLLQHFRNYLEGEESKEKQIPNEHTGSLQNFYNLEAGSIYVKKWMRTKHAIMFRLSNKVVQVIFQDQTEIILSSELRVVTYVNKKHERLQFPLSTALESSNQEMTKRLKYTKDILTHMLGGNSGNQGTQHSPYHQYNPSSENGTSNNAGKSSLTNSTGNLKSYSTNGRMSGNKKMESTAGVAGFENFNATRSGSQTGRISLQNIGSNGYLDKNA